MQDKDYTDAAIQYCEDVTSGRRGACVWVKLACQKFLDDLQDCESPDSKYIYDDAKAHKPCRFIEMLRHTRGIWAQQRKNIVLEPWQCFWICGIFGFVHRETGLRRCRETFLFVPRKNAKSTVSGCILLYMLCADGEGAPECYSGSPKLRQSMECWTVAQRNVKLNPALKTAFGLDARTQSIITDTGGKCIPTVRSPGDGSSPSAYVVDEIHELLDDSIINVFRLGTAARQQPLGLFTSTAGNNTSGVCFDMVEESKKVLEGVYDRPEFFPLLYTIDADTDWTSEQALWMASPNCGVSVSLEKLKTEQKNAVQNARQTNAFLTKFLNVFVGTNTAFFNLSKWNALGSNNLTPADFAGCPCYIGVDLASKIDLTAVTKVFRKEENGKTTFGVFPRLYLPMDRIQDPASPHYAAWEKQGFLIGTPGAMVDYSAVLADLIEDIERYNVEQVACDGWNAGSLMQQVSEQTSATVIEVQQTVRNLSEPTKALEAFILAGAIAHTNNPVQSWCLGNVVCHEDTNGGVKPNKPRDPKAKTDGAISLILALSRAMLGTTEQADWFQPFSF